MRQIYVECVEEADDGAVDSRFKHLRSAKHRIETWLTPVSRSLTQPSGAICYSYVKLLISIKWLYILSRGVEGPEQNSHDQVRKSMF